MRKFYLAHPLSDRKEIRKWQEKMESMYNVEFYNPFYEQHRKEIEDLDKLKSKKKRYEYKKNMTAQTCGQIIRWDLDMVRKSDGIVAFVRPGVMGTVMEIFYASYMLRLPVYIITDKYNATHPWLRTLSDEIYSDKDDFEDIIEDKYGFKGDYEE